MALSKINNAVAVAYIHSMIDIDSLASSMAYLKPRRPIRKPYSSPVHCPSIPIDHTPIIDEHGLVIRHSVGDDCILAIITLITKQIHMYALVYTAFFSHKYRHSPVFHELIYY